MTYGLLRALAGIALRWYYRDIQVQGRERIPTGAPLLLVVNHPNALVDALVVGTVVPRRVLITAKATLFANPIAAALLRYLGVLPLRRAADVREDERRNPARNDDTFRAVREALGRRGAVLIFPEGKSHDEPELAPLKSGAARMALQAHRSGDAPRLTVVPIGLTFERKESPRTRVLVQVGEPICLDDWAAPEGRREVEALTSEIDVRLRAVTLNFSSADRAARATALASLITAIMLEPPAIGARDRRLALETHLAGRIDAIRSELDAASPELRARVDRLLTDLLAIHAELRSRRIRLEDVSISRRWRDGLRFIFRESWILLTAGPLALWGRINHWLPLRLARAIAARSVESAADPAMRTIVAGLGLILLAYAAQGIAVGMLFGTVTAVIYLVSLPVAADVNFRLSDRLARATQRARTFLLFRSQPELQRTLMATLARLRDETAEVEKELGGRRTGGN